jgi:hypothetical protein
MPVDSGAMGRFAPTHNCAVCDDSFIRQSPWNYGERVCNDCRAGFEIARKKVGPASEKLERKEGKWVQKTVGGRGL